MPTLSVIIISFNVRSYLYQCLRTVRAAVKGIDAEIIVVDNCSTDGSAGMVSRCYPEVILVKNTVNSGFARANNQAMLRAQGRFYALVNPDTLLDSDTFQVCIDYLKAHADTGMVGCRILNPDGTLQPACRRSIPTPWVAFTRISGLSRLFPKSYIFGRYNVTYLDEHEINEVEAVSGSFMVVRSEAVSRAGLLDEAFFMYGEDLDWCLRFAEHGLKIVYLPLTSIIHYKGKSSGKGAFRQARIFYAAMKIFVRKHFKYSWIIPKQVLLAGIYIKEGVSLLLRLLRRAGYLLTDVVFLQIGLAAAIVIRFGNIRPWSTYLFINIIYTAVWLLVFFLSGLYGRHIFCNIRTAAAVVGGFIVNAALTFFVPQFAFSRQVLITALALNSLSITGWRLIRHSQSLRSFAGIIRGNTRKRVLLIGREPSIRSFAARVENNSLKGYLIAGYLGWNCDSDSDAGNVRLLGTADDVVRIVRAHKIEEIIFPFEKMGEKAILSVMHRCRSEKMYYRLTLAEPGAVTGFSPADILKSGSLLVDFNPAVYKSFNVFLKRMIDLSLIVLLLPAFLTRRLFLLFRRKSSRPSVLISDGADSYVKIAGMAGIPSVRHRPVFPFFSMILRGDMSFCGSPLTPFQAGVSGYGYKPGIISVLDAAPQTEDSCAAEALFFNYLSHYSIFTDVRLLKYFFFNRRTRVKGCS